MGTRDKRVDAYITRSAEFARPILSHLRELVHQACPEATETIKWGFPHFEYKGLLCSMASFKKHCAFGFWKAKLMTDKDSLLTPVGKTAMGNFGRITALKDLPADAKIRKYIREACALNESPRKAGPPSDRKKKALVVPSYFRKELSKNPEAMANFKAFSYSHRKDYIDWISEAKTEPTRQRRMATSVQWLAAGKGRNWKYER